MVASHVKGLGYPSHEGKAGRKALQHLLCTKEDNYNKLIESYYYKFIVKMSKELPLDKVKYPDKFYKSKAWLDVRTLVFSVFGNRCLCCGSKEEIQVDHVKPRSRHPELALKIINLQPLCKECNLLKGVNTIDYRDENLHKGRKRWLELKRKEKQRVKNFLCIR